MNKVMMRVLLVDDHEVVRRGTKQIIAEEFPQASFGEASSIQEALDLLMSKSWDVVLLDINLPGRNGLDLLEQIKQLHPQLPILVVSAYPEEDYAVRSFKLGASGYLTKSSASDEMIVAIRKTLAGNRYITASLAEKLAAALGQKSFQVPHEALSQRELQVLRMVASGKTIREVAAEMALSEKTIATYRARISQKLSLSTNVELTRYALQHRLVD